MSKNVEPLKEYNLLESEEVDVSQKIVSDMYCEHYLIPLKGEKVDAKLNAIEGDHFNFGFLTYGVDAKIDLPSLPPCYHVNVTLSGQSDVNHKNGATYKTEGLQSGAILLPDNRYDVVWKEKTAQYAFRFHQENLESHLSSLILEPVRSTIHFDTIFNLQSSAGGGLLRACQLLQTEWEQDSTFVHSPFARRHLEAYIMTSFLLAAENPYSEKLLVDYQTKDMNEALVRRVVTYIEERIHELPELSDLTSYAMVSARTLQLAFKRYLEMTPMQYVQKVRLERAHAHILAARYTGEKITEIAMQWGFYNPGRFSQLYKKLYGCTPSETLLK